MGSPVIYEKDSDVLTLFIQKRSNDKIVEIPSSEQNLVTFQDFDTNSIVLDSAITDPNTPSLDDIKTFLMEDSKMADRIWKNVLRGFHTENKYFVGIAMISQLTTASGRVLKALHSDPRVVLKKSMSSRIYKAPNVISFPLNYAISAKTEITHDFTKEP